MTSTHTFVWENCSLSGEFYFILHNSDREHIDVECAALVRRCCARHKEIDKHESHYRVITIRVEDTEKIPSQETRMTVYWDTSEKTMGPAKQVIMGDTRKLSEFEQ